jgi:hypothetical protein
MAPVVNVFTGCEPKHLRLVEMPVLEILNIFDSRAGSGKPRRIDVSFQFVRLTAVPFCVNNEGNAFLEAELRKGGG